MTGHYKYIEHLECPVGQNGGLMVALCKGWQDKLHFGCLEKS